MPNKVFSIEKYSEWLKKQLHYTEEQAQKNIQRWAIQCEGKTKEEMKELGCATSSEWMKEEINGKGNQHTTSTR